MKVNRWLWASLLAGTLAASRGRADERRFTYVYEPETLPARAFEVENWVTLGAGRDATVGQDNYRSWNFRQELEYGMTDWYAAALYLNEQTQSYDDPVSGAHCWLQKAVNVRKAQPGENYGDVFVDTQRSMQVYRQWLALTRSAVDVSPDGTRRPAWLQRPLRPVAAAFKLPEKPFGH